jgi:hypothetical protein
VTSCVLFSAMGLRDKLWSVYEVMVHFNLQSPTGKIFAIKQNIKLLTMLY